MRVFNSESGSEVVDVSISVPFHEPRLHFSQKLLSGNIYYLYDVLVHRMVYAL